MESNYTLYSASAGSGKTYGLVKAFLKILLKEQRPMAFKNLLAITFTNKAVHEMKHRIIETLSAFAKGETSHSMFVELQSELQLTEEEMQLRSRQILRSILYNYSAFSISTIDAFNHKIVRNFALDLRLNPNFEISLDIDILLERAVDQLLQRVGTDPDLTQWLIAFAKEKVNEDKNWDLASDLLKIGKMTTQENHYRFLYELQDKTLSDFKKIKQLLRQKNKHFKDTIKENARLFVSLCSREQLSKKDFSGGYVYTFFHNLYQNPEFNISWGKQWMKNLETAPLYAKTYKGDKREVLDRIAHDVFQWFTQIREAYYGFLFHKDWENNLTPLALINQIQHEMNLLKKEENTLPLHEVNKLIFNKISDQPTPFIYERIGEYYHHFFIDEFQDTSELQWKNLIPLAANALQSENLSHRSGSLLIVGDAKQSIYRWRGGKAEQFMNLYLQQENPFYVPASVKNLAENYRSLPEIINFNNDFYRFISSSFTNESYQKLYREAAQQIPPSTLSKQIPGYVCIDFLPSDTADKNEIYCHKVLEYIQKAVEQGASYSDICVLVRQNKEGNLIAEFLTQQGIKVISPDSLLLHKVPSISFLIYLLRLISDPDHASFKAEFLLFYAQMRQVSDVHRFMKTYLSQPIHRFFEEHQFSIEKFHTLSLFEGVLYAIKRFCLALDSDAYLSHFLDILLDFRKQKRGGVLDFLTYWEEQKSKLSLSAPEGIEAVSIMTVHRSKGLSAPVIIFAFANSVWDSFKADEKHWISVNPEDFEGFQHLLMTPKKEFLEYSSPITEELQQLQQQKFIDHVNVLYVATTRPESMLFIITEEREKGGSYGQLFKDFLCEKKMWNPECSVYEFGKPQFPKKKKSSHPETYIPFIQGNDNPSFHIVTPSASLWGTHQDQSRTQGLLIHELLRQICYEEDLENALEDSLLKGIISSEQKTEFRNHLSRIIHHPKLHHFYQKPYVIDNEREFISSEGRFLRPDRVVYDPPQRQAIVIDYKTGAEEKTHILQISNYAHLLEELGWNISHKLLVYIGKDILVKSC